MIARPAKPRRPARPRLPGNNRAATGAVPQGRIGVADTDEFGLSRDIFGHLPPRARQYLARAYTHWGLDKMVAPIHQQMPGGDTGNAGTIPEMVFYGGLLERNMLPFKDFQFQHELLGGRDLPGGAVADFIVFVNGEKVGVPVQSPFHAETFVFAGLAKVNLDLNQQVRLTSRGAIDRVVLVNEPPSHYLEAGPDVMVDREFRRVLIGV